MWKDKTRIPRTVDCFLSLTTWHNTKTLGIKQRWNRDKRLSHQLLLWYRGWSRSVNENNNYRKCFVFVWFGLKWKWKMIKVELPETTSSLYNTSTLSAVTSFKKHFIFMCSTHTQSDDTLFLFIYHFFVDISSENKHFSVDTSFYFIGILISIRHVYVWGFIPDRYVGYLHHKYIQYYSYIIIIINNNKKRKKDSPKNEMWYNLSIKCKYLTIITE